MSDSTSITSFASYDSIRWILAHWKPQHNNLQWLKWNYTLQSGSIIKIRFSSSSFFQMCFHQRKFSIESFNLESNIILNLVPNFIFRWVSCLMNCRFITNITDVSMILHHPKSLVNTQTHTHKPLLCAPMFSEFVLSPNNCWTSWRFFVVKKNCQNYGSRNLCARTKHNNNNGNTSKSNFVTGDSVNGDFEACKVHNTYHFGLVGYMIGFVMSIIGNWITLNFSWNLSSSYFHYIYHRCKRDSNCLHSSISICPF